MGLYLQCIVRFRHLSHMLSHYVQISSSIHARLFGNVRYCMLTQLTHNVNVTFEKGPKMVRSDLTF